MGKCKAVLCSNEVIAPRVYCGQSCRTRTTNSLYKDYGRMSAVRKAENRKKYTLKKCKQCSKPIEFERKVNDFCSNSCRASFTNRLRVGEKRVFTEAGLANIRAGVEKRTGKGVRPTTVKPCPVCGVQCRSRYKYCSRACYTVARSRETRNTNPLVVYRQLCRFTFGLGKYPERSDLGP